MHIVLVHQYFCPPGGAGNNRSCELVSCWVEQGIKVTVVTSPACFPVNDKKLAQSCLKDVELIVIPVSYSHFMPLSRRVWSFLAFMIGTGWYLMRRKNFDLLYAVSTPPTTGLLGVMVKKCRKIPFVFEIGDLWPDVPFSLLKIRNKWFKAPFYKLEHLIYRHSILLVPLSEGMKDALVEKGIDSKKIYVSPNGTNPHFFKPTMNKGYHKQALGYLPEDVIFLYAGTFGKANRMTILSEAASWFSEKGYNNVHFLLLGNGNDSATLISEIQRLKVQNIKIFSAVPKERVMEYFSAADVGLVVFAPYPILETNGANKFFDYLASGLPVCINYSGWQREWLEHNNCGVGSNQGDKESFFKEMEKLVIHPEKRIEMGHHARKKACEQFNRHTLATELLEILKKTY